MKFRPLPLLAQAAAVLTVAAGALGVTALGKSVNLSVDGKATEVHAFGSTVADILDSEDITVGSRDSVVPSLGSQVRDGDTITVRYARKHYAAPNLEFLQASCTTLPLRAGSVEVAAAFEVIEHLEDWRSLLDELRRVLAPGGLLFISTPNKAYYAEARASADERNAVLAVVGRLAASAA